VRHRRFAPTRHQFRYGVCLFYLAIDDLEGAGARSRLFANERPALVSFRRADHLGDPRVPLGEAVRSLCQERLGYRPSGPIYLLTHPRYFGYVMNPVSFFYCFEANQTDLSAIVAEVNNTPWGERHTYVLGGPVEPRRGPTRRFVFAKEFHVSPFMQMDLEYDWRFVTLGRRLAVHMENRRGGELLFDATMTLRRRPLSSAGIRRALVRYPFMTARVLAAIYWQALRLWSKGTPFFEHPSRPRVNPRRPVGTPDHLGVGRTQ
jgi:uncharacterized protein